MSRINTNVNSLLGQRVLGQQNRALNTSLERLSTGLRINRGADDPAGLIASENLRSQKASIEAAIGNAERAEQVVNVAEGGLQEINNLLLNVQSLVGQSANDAGLSVEEKEANQLQIDSILQTIDRISETTSFQGTKLLNGNYDFNVEAQDPEVEDITVNAAKIARGDERDLNVIVTQSAQTAGLFLSAGGGQLHRRHQRRRGVHDRRGGGQRQPRVQLRLGHLVYRHRRDHQHLHRRHRRDRVGPGGRPAWACSPPSWVRKTSSRSTSKTTPAWSAAVNFLSSNDTTASTVGGTAFSAASNAIRDEGQDVGATINGVRATTRGATASISSDFLDVSIDLTTAGAQAPAPSRPAPSPAAEPTSTWAPTSTSAIRCPSASARCPAATWAPNRTAS